MLNQILKKLKFSKLNNNQSGSSFLMVLSAMVILYIMGSAFVIMVANETKTVKTERSKVKAHFVAEAGLQYGVYKRVRYPLQSNANLGASLTNVNYGGGKFTVTFMDVNTLNIDDVRDCDTDATGFCADGHSDIRKVISVATVDDTAGGSAITLNDKQSFLTESPFNRAIWATGNLQFRTSFNLNWCLVTFSLWCADDLWRVTGKIFAPNQSYDDWERHCPPFDWFDDCDKYWLVGWRCCLLLKGCSSGQSCCCGFSKDTGSRYAVRKSQNQVFTVCGGYNGDCNSNGANDEEETQAGGGGLGSGLYYVKDNTTFPQFTPPGDPRLPGSSTGLNYMTGPDASNSFNTNLYLRNVWVDGNLVLNAGWFDQIGTKQFGIWGVVYIKGAIILTGSVFSKFRMCAYDGFKNYDGTFDCSGDTGLTTPPDYPPPGTLIIQKGNLDLVSTGTPNFGRVNLVLIEGNQLTLSSFCGVKSWGIYYVGGPLTDHDSNINTPPIRMGGDISFDANTRYGPLTEPLRFLCDGVFGLYKEQIYSEFHGAVIGHNISFKGSDKWDGGNVNNPNVVGVSDPLVPAPGNQPNVIDILANPDIQIPDGFYRTIKVYNFKEE